MGGMRMEEMERGRERKGIRHAAARAGKVTGVKRTWVARVEDAPKGVGKTRKERWRERKGMGGIEGLGRVKGQDRGQGN